MASRRHRGDTATFEELDQAGRSRSISAQLLTLQRAILGRARRPASLERRDQLLRQVDRFGAEHCYRRTPHSPSVKEGCPKTSQSQEAEVTSTQRPKTSIHSYAFNAILQAFGGESWAKARQNR